MRVGLPLTYPMYTPRHLPQPRRARPKARANEARQETRGFTIHSAREIRHLAPAEGARPKRRASKMREEFRRIHAIVETIDVRNGETRQLLVRHVGEAADVHAVHLADGRLGADTERAQAYFSRACEARFQPGCLNLLDDADLTAAVPRVLDLRLLLREGGPNLMDMGEPALYARACRHGWRFACEKVSASR